MIKSKDSKTGNPLIIETITKGSDKLYIYRDKVTGETRYRTYGVSAAGGGQRLTGGANIGGISEKDNTKIKTELGKSGLVPVTNKYGKVTGFKSSVTRKSYPYTDAGITAFNKDMKTSGSQFRQVIKTAGDTGMSVKKTPKETTVSFIKNIASAFSIKKFKQHREKQREEIYDIYGLAGKDRNFNSLMNAARNTNLSNAQKTALSNKTMKILEEDVTSKDNKISVRTRDK
jgi:gas vesicle protein